MILSKFAYSCAILLCKVSNLLNKNISRHFINYGIFLHALVVTKIMANFVFSWWTQKLAAFPNFSKRLQLYVCCSQLLWRGRASPVWEMRLLTLLMLLSCFLTILMACMWSEGLPNFYFCTIAIHKGEISQFAMIPFSGGVHNYIIHCWDGKNKISITDLFSLI